MDKNSELYKWIVVSLFVILMVGLTIFYHSQEVAIRKYIQKSQHREDYAWEAHPDGTIIAYPSKEKTKTEVLTLPDGRKYVVIPTGDTLIFKSTNIKTE